MVEDNEHSHCVIGLEHIAACTNKSPSCLSWGTNDLIAMGSSNSVVISENKTKEGTQSLKAAIKTLNKHTGRVNCVKWMKKSAVQCESCFLLSGSTDKTVIVWKVDHHRESNKYAFEPCIHLQGHTSTVTSVDGMIFNKDIQSMKSIVVSTGVDSSILIWGCFATSDTEWKDSKLIQKIDFGRSLVLSMSLHALSNETPILACGLDNSRIELYCYINQKDEGVLFIPMLSLTGHEDWVRGTDFLTLENNDLMLASCSQDGFVRLWRICKKDVDVESDTDTLKIRQMKFITPTQCGENTFVVHLDAVLSGHEGWVYSVQWNKNEDGRIRLISSSMDKSVIIWEVDEESGIWIEKFRFGEVGGNTLGFYGAVFNANGTQVAAHSYNGALHLWEETMCDEKRSQWKTGVILSGHCNNVLDISWEPKHGRYLVSTSVDQTTRLFAIWNKAGKKSWHEIARPQVHGYDMQCISMIDSCRFISGADEKVLRVFEAPQNFLHNLEKLSGIKVTTSRVAPEGATIPALGLSNKAVNIIENTTAEETSRGEKFIENQFKSLILQQPPSEEHLLQNSLWPETNKLYWHVYEIFCVAANSSGTLVASAAKSATPQHATIVLWSTETWKEVAQLHGHTLTVTQMEFSNNGEFLLSVSRDRTWLLHRVSVEQNNTCSAVLFAKSVKSTCHARIIWSVTWTHDDNYFCTGSRDKKIMFWKVNKTENSVGEPSGLDLVSRVLVTNASEAVTAVAFANTFTSELKYLLAVGKESGLLELYLFDSFSSERTCVLFHKFNIYQSHSATVKRIRWRPVEDAADKSTFDQYVATCGEDNMVKLYSVHVRCA